MLALEDEGWERTFGPFRRVDVPNDAQVRECWFCGQRVDAGENEEAWYSENEDRWLHDACKRDMNPQPCTEG